MLKRFLLFAGRAARGRAGQGRQGTGKARRGRAQTRIWPGRTGLDGPRSLQSPPEWGELVEHVQATRRRECGDL